MIDSTAEFHAVIGAAVSMAFVEVINKAYEELQKQIQSVVDGGYSPSDYGRTEGLLIAWRKQVGGLDAEMYFDPPRLPLSPANWQHGSKYDGGDMRSAIIDIISSGYNAFNANTGKPIPARPFWDKFMASCDANIDKWIRQALRHQGLMVI